MSEDNGKAKYSIYEKRDKVTLEGRENKIVEVKAMDKSEVKELFDYVREKNG